MGLAISGCFPADHQHHRAGLLGPGVNPAGLFDRENLAAIFAAAQVGGAGLELEVEIAAGAVAVVVGELHLHVDAVVFVGVDLLPFLVSAGEAGAHLQQQQLALAAGGEFGEFLLAEGFGLAERGVGEEALQVVVEGEGAIAGVAHHLGAFAIARELLHQHRPVALGSVAVGVGAEPMATPLHRFGGLTQVPIDELGELHPLRVRHRRRHVQGDRAFAGVVALELHRQCLGFGRLGGGEAAELGGVAPEILQAEHLGFGQAHHQGGVDLIEPAAHFVAHERRRQGGGGGPLAAAMAGEHQLAALAQADLAILQLALQLGQQHLLFGGLQPRLVCGEGQLGGGDGADGQGAELGFGLAQAAQHRLAVEAQPFRLEQNVIAVVEFFEHAGAIEQAEHGLEGGVVEAGGVDALAQALAQILVGEQRLALITQPQDLPFDLLEQPR